jgi:septum formation protein
MKLVLCSASPRRRAFLAQLGLVFELVSPEVDEARHAGESPRALAERLAQAKAVAGVAALRARGVTGDLVALAADTVVALRAESGLDLAKPSDRADAARMLGILSGREHVVLSGVAVKAADGTVRSECVETTVRFRQMSAAEIAWLAASGDGDDKAGAYAVQGLAGSFIERLDGSFTNVVGLPMTEAVALLAQAGVPMPWDVP